MPKSYNRVGVNYNLIPMKPVKFNILLLAIAFVTQINAQKITYSILNTSSLPNSYGNILDGDNSTYWQAAANTTTDLYLNITSTTQPVKYLALTTSTGQYSYQIWASTSSTSFTTIVAPLTAGSVNQLIALNTGSSSYQYFKIEFTLHSYTYPDKINNIELYNILPNNYSQLIYGNIGSIGLLYTTTLNTGTASITGSLNAGATTLTSLVNTGAITTGSLTSSGAITTASLTSSGAITATNINSSGDLLLQGGTYSGATPGKITVGKAYANYYPYGGDVTITAGTGYMGNSIYSGKINLVGATSITGSLGIGTSPLAPLHVFGTSLFEVATDKKLEVCAWDISGLGGVTLNAHNGANTANVCMSFAASQFYFRTGNVGIGCTDTKGYLLAVAGPMIATQVVVKLQTYWPDNVFQPGYKLKPLAEVESFIKANKHLEGIPTETEVKEKGIDVGDMNTTLLKKVEELTLYVIELKKENDALKAQVDVLCNK